MKKLGLFIAILSVMSLASCKKDRICSCVTVETSGSTTTTDPAEEITYTKSKKSEARAACLSSSQTEVNGSVTTTIVTTCELK